MRKSLLILAGLMAFAATNTALAQHRDKAFEKGRKEKKELKAEQKADSFSKNNSNAAKAGGDDFVSITPDGTMKFTLNGCNATQSRPLVIKNNSDMRVNGYFEFVDDATGNIYSDIEFDKPVFGDKNNDYYNKWLFNYFEVNGFAYAYNYDHDCLVKTDLATGKQTLKFCDHDDYSSLTYDGKTFWASDYDGNIYALDADLNPTGKIIEVDYTTLVVWNGTELLAVERRSSPAHVKAFDTNGNLKADYGTIELDQSSIIYNANTGLYWATVNNYNNIVSFTLQNGKMEIKDLFVTPGHVIVGFDADNNPYIMDYESSCLYKTKQFSHSPKGIEMSQLYYDIEPYGQTTINITATAELGSRTINIYNYDELFSTLKIDVDANPEYSLSAESMQFATVAGIGAEIQTLWVKNTGCSPMGIPNEPTIDGDAFGIVGFVLPDDFSGSLMAGDSIGVKVGCYSANAGTFDGTLTWGVTGAEDIELPLSATVAAANCFTIPESATATIDCGAGTATIAANITNNSGQTMKVVPATNANVTFHIQTADMYSEEMKWQLMDVYNNILHEEYYNSYSDNSTYTVELELPAGEYTLKMFDRYGDGWISYNSDAYGYIDVIVNGTTILNHATVGYTDIEEEEIQNTEKFNIEFATIATIANGESVSQLTVPLNTLNIGESTELQIVVEGVMDHVGSFNVTTPAGEPEMVVNETSIDFGMQVIDPENPYLFGTQTLTITNTGCGPLLISSIAIGNDDDFMFWDEDIDGFAHSLSNIAIEPDSSFKKTIYFEPSAAEVCTGTLTITPAGTDAETTTVELKGTGIGLPVAEFSYNYDSEKRLGFKSDTIDCSQSSTTLKGRIANSGTGPLIVSEPIRIEYQAGNKNNQSFYLYDTYGDYEYYNYSSDDYCYYFYPSNIDRIMVCGYGCDGKIIISNGKKTLHTINLADIVISEWFDIVATETDTIAPGDTLELEMPVIPNGIGEKNFYYYLTTNDPENEKIEMNGKVRVINAPKLVFPEVIDFGEVTVGTESWKYITYENEGCGNFNFNSFSVTNTENPLVADWGEVGFAPTAAGTFTNTLTISTYYYTAASEPVTETFEVTLKGTAVVSPTAVFTTDHIPATVDYDKKVATATTTVTNTGTSTALKLCKDNDTIIVEPGASANINFEISVKGYDAAAEYDVPFTYYTNDAANPSITFYVAFPIDEIFEYDFNKDSVEFAPVHTGITSYSSITLRNRGTLNVNSGDAVWFKEESNSKFLYTYVTNSVAYLEDSITYYFEFYSDEAGTFRDTLYIQHGTRKTDSIPFVATANNTSVIAVSTPNSRYAVAGDTIAINVTFDGTVVLIDDDELELMPQMKVNTGGFAVLDSTALLDSRNDLYTLTFLYAVQNADNVALFDYTEDSVYMNGHSIVVDDSDVCDTIALPAVGTLASTFPVTIDNKAPQFASADFSQDGLSLVVIIKFNEPVTGLNESSLTLTGGATLVSLTTKDNISYTAVINLANCVDIDVNLNATITDLAGNSKKATWSQTIPAIHNYTATVVAPTCTEDGYTLMVCSLCKHEEKTNVVAAAGHKPGKPTIEANGDEVVYCTVCNAELSRKEGTTAIAEDEAVVAIYAIGQTVVVEVAEPNGAEINVIDMNGRVVAKAQANNSRTEITLPVAGIYMVNVGQTTEKVVLQ